MEWITTLHHTYRNLAKPMQTRVRVLLADDHVAIQTRVREVLEPEFDVVRTVGNGQLLVDAVRELNPDVVVVDISMPVLSGIEAVRRIMKSGSSAKVVFLTVNEDPDIIPICLEAGALGFVVKSSLASDLIPAIRLALINRTYISPTVPWEHRS